MKSLRKIETVLDIGCGYGEMLGYLSTEMPNVKFTAFDFDTSYVKTYFAKNNLNLVNITLQDIDLYALLTQNQPRSGVFGQKYDVVLLGEVLEHFEDPKLLIELLESFVKETGMIVISVPTGYWFDSHHLQCYRFSDLKAMLGHKDMFRYTHLATSKGAKNLRCGNWVVSYVYDKSKKVYEIDYDAKIRTEVPRETVSFCMMVKDEEENIVRALNSAHPFFDEYIITDTGCTDSTMEIVEKIQKNPVFEEPLITNEFKWSNRFDDARNAMVEKATGDWIYWMDTDEILCNAGEIRKYLYSTYFDGYSMAQNHIVSDRQQTSDSPLRLYRNLNKIKFYGVVHEMPMIDINSPVEPQMHMNDISLMHFGYLTEMQRRVKGTVRNLPLLKKDREIFPERKMGVGLIMRDLLHLGRWELEAKQGFVTEKGYNYYQRIIRIWRNSFKDCKDKYDRELVYSIYQQALHEMAIAGIYVEDSGLLPVEIVFALKGGVGGVANPNEPVTDRFWIGFQDELEIFLIDKQKLLIDACRQSVDRFIEPVFVEKASNLYANLTIDEKYDSLPNPNKLEKIKGNTKEITE
jgi:glycosyltransferase involved in cell wall biosynthesis